MGVMGVAMVIVILLHLCTAAVVISDNGVMAKEEILDKVKTIHVQLKTSNLIQPNSKASSLGVKGGSISVFNKDNKISQESSESSSESKSSDEDSSSMETKNDENIKYIRKLNFDKDTSSCYESFEVPVPYLGDRFVNKRELQKRSIKENNTSSDESSSSSDDNSNSSDLEKNNVIVKRSLNSNEDALNEIDDNPDEIEGSKVTATDSSKTTNPTTESTAPTTIVNGIAETQDETEPSTSTDFITTIQTTEATKAETDQAATTVEHNPTTSSENTLATTVENESTTTENSGTTESKDKEATTESENEAKTETAKELTTETDIQTETASEVTPPSSTTELDEDANSKEETDEGSLPSATTSSTETDPSEPEEKKEPTFTDAAMARVDKLSDQIRLVLFEFRKTNVVVIPNQTFFPDPMGLQDFQQAFSIGNMNFMNMKIHGLSNFTVEHINTDVDRMQVYCLLHMKRLVILGNYTLKTFFSRAAGPFNVTLLDVDSEGVAEVASAPEGHLEATDSNMDMFTKDMKMDFKNMGFFGSMFKSIATSVGDVIFNSIKPQILEKVNVVIRNDVNKKLKDFSVKFINKVAPVDLAISEGRKYVRDNGYDPYHIKDHTFLLGGLVYVNITEFVVQGLSRFHRIGNLSLSMDKGTIEIGVHVATEQLSGKCDWSGQTFGIVKYGKTNFTVHHLQARALVTQSLDVRKKPQLEKLDLELGYVRVTMDSPMALTYMIEGVINAFPRLIRHIIVDALEQPLKVKVQELLDKVNIESLVDENLPRLDSFGL